MTAQDLITFRDAVAAEVADQYPKTDYLNAVVARVIERRVELLGWEWLNDGPTRKQTGG
jgi:hypothetical protein